MNERDLRYFATIVESGSLRRASERLHISQPALTKCVSRLEEQLDTVLFERRGRRVRVTAVGEVLLRRARQIIRHLDETQREVHDYARGKLGHLRIGAAATLTEYLLPEALGMLLECYPEITFALRVGMSDVLREALRSDQLDVVLGPIGESAEFECHPIVEDQVVVVACPEHPLARRVARPEELEAFRWVLPGAGVATRDWLERSMVQLGLPAPVVQIEASSLALMSRLISRANLLSFVSRRSLSALQNDHRLVEIPFEALTLHRHFGILTRREGYVSPASQALIALLTQSGAALFRG